MFTYKEKTGFTYNGRHTDEFNVISVSLDSGMFEESFVSSRTIDDVYLTGNKATMLKSITREPLSFEIKLAFKDKFTEDLADRVIDWLYGNSYYRPLKFDGSNRIVYVMPDGESTITHTGFEEGFISLTMKSNSPFVFGDIQSKKSAINTESSVVIAGLNNPEIKIDVIVKKSGTLKIVVNGYTLQIKNLIANEVVTIYPETEEISSNVSNVYHYSDYIGDLSKLNFKKGLNAVKLVSDNGDTTSEMNITYQEYYNK